MNYEVRILCHSVTVNNSSYFLLRSSFCYVVYYHHGNICNRTHYCICTLLDDGKETQERWQKRRQGRQGRQEVVLWICSNKKHGWVRVCFSIRRSWFCGDRLPWCQKNLPRLPNPFSHKTGLQFLERYTKNAWCQFPMLLQVAQAGVSFSLCHYYDSQDGSPSRAIDMPAYFDTAWSWN